MPYTEFERITWLKKKVESKVTRLGIKGVYGDLENLMSDTKFVGDYVVIHQDDTINVEQIGLGMELQETSYFIVWVTKKLKKERNTSVEQNVNNINDFNVLFPKYILEGMGDSDCPFMLVGDMANGVGNEEDPIGLPGDREFKGKLVIWCQVNLQFRVITSVR